MSVLREHLKNAKVTLDDAKTTLEAERKELKRIELIRDDLTAQIADLNTRADKAASNNAAARIQGTQLFDGLSNIEGKLSASRRELSALEVHIATQIENGASASHAVLAAQTKVDGIVRELVQYLTSEKLAGEYQQLSAKLYPIYRQLGLSIARVGGSARAATTLQEAAQLMTWRDASQPQLGHSNNDKAFLRELDNLALQLIENSDYEVEI